MAARSAAAGTQRKYWLFKSEPEAFSIQDLAKAPKKTSYWHGVRNYQARNYLRDEVQLGDRVLFYHSSTDPLEIVGTMEVVKAGYPDHTAFDPKADYYDPKSDPDSPRWYMVDVKLLQLFAKPVTREVLAASPKTAGMLVLKRGMRLSIQPVTAAEWQAVHELAGVNDKS
jgi:predicted RNA-binding protein with PUA-like domain